MGKKSGSTSHAAPSPQLVEAVRTFISDESTYFEQIVVLVKIFATPTRELSLMSTQLYKDVFLNIEEICKFHGALLAKAHEFVEQAEADESSACVLPTLRFLMDHLETLDTYVSGCSVGIERCLDFQMGNEKFTKLLEKRRDEYGNLYALLNLPMARACKYPSYIRQMARLVPSDKAHGVVHDWASKLERWAEQKAQQGRRDATEYKKLADVQRRVDGFDVIVPSRMLIHEGPVFIHGRGERRRDGERAKEGDLKERRLFLFNDMLVACTPKMFKRKQLDYSFRIELDHTIRLKHIPAEVCPRDFYGFKVEKGAHITEFWVRLDPDKSEWLNYISSVVATLASEAGVDVGGDSEESDVSTEARGGGGGGGASSNNSQRRSGTIARRSASETAFRLNSKPRSGTGDSVGSNASQASLVIDESDVTVASNSPMRLGSRMGSRRVRGGTAVRRTGLTQRSTSVSALAADASDERDRGEQESSETTNEAGMSESGHVSGQYREKVRQAEAQLAVLEHALGVARAEVRDARADVARIQRELDLQRDEFEQERAQLHASVRAEQARVRSLHDDVDLSECDGVVPTDFLRREVRALADLVARLQRDSASVVVDEDGDAAAAGGGGGKRRRKHRR